VKLARSRGAREAIAFEGDSTADISASVCARFNLLDAPRRTIGLIFGREHVYMLRSIHMLRKASTITNSSLARSAIAPLIFTCLLGWGSAATRAQATFDANTYAGVPGAFDQDWQTDATTPVSIASQVSTVEGTASAAAIADRGCLQLSGAVNAVNATQRSTSGSSIIRIRFDDVIIHRIDGQPSDIDLSPTLQYFLSLGADWTGQPVPAPGQSSALASMTAQMGQFVSLRTRTEILRDDYNGSPSGPTGLNTLSDFPIRTDVPFVVRLSIDTAEFFADVSNAGQYSMTMNVGPTADPSDLPVFLLPDGFTADSPSMNVVNNRWQGVPEPSCLSLITTLCIITWRTRRTTAGHRNHRLMPAARHRQCGNT
jgi:hypothetical protein